MEKYYSLNGQLIPRVIDEKYEIKRAAEHLWNAQPGLGDLLIVDATSATGMPGTRLFMKRFRIPEKEPRAGYYDETRERFQREVLTINEFRGNPKVVQILDFNLNTDPPYYITSYFPKGTLVRIAGKFESDYSTQETLFTEIIDCISDLHAKAYLHRDITPRNFMIADDATPVLCNFGLCADLNSPDEQTWFNGVYGDECFKPPEFHRPGGFQAADVTSDIFMLGSSIASVVTGKFPNYIEEKNLPVPLSSVINKCRAVEKGDRYQSVGELRDSLVAAYDVLLDR